MADNEVYGKHYEVMSDNGPSLYEVPQESLRESLRESHSTPLHTDPEVVYEPTTEGNIYALPDSFTGNGVRYFTHNFVFVNV